MDNYKEQILKMANNSEEFKQLTYILSLIFYLYDELNIKIDDKKFEEIKIKAEKKLKEKLKKELDEHLGSLEKFALDTLDILL